jgi:hypothetical protein
MVPESVFPDSIFIKIRQIPDSFQINRLIRMVWWPVGNGKRATMESTSALATFQQSNLCAGLTIPGGQIASL